MRYFGKRVLSFIVAMGIIATMLPVNVLAEEISSSQMEAAASSSSEPAATETPAPTPVPSSSEDSSSSSQPQVTATPTPVPSPTETPVPTASATPEPSASPTPSPTPTPTPEESAADRIKAALEARKAAVAAAGVDAFGTDNRTQTEITPFQGTATQLYAPNGTSYITSQTSLVNLVVFMRFADQTEYLNTDSVTAFNKVYNSNDGSYYSLKHYLEAMSYGTVSATGAAFPRSADGQTFVSVQLTHPENYYKPYSATNTIGYTTDAEARSREGAMLTEAVNGAKAQISGVYTDAQLDVHGAVGGGADGYLDAITFAYLPEKTSVPIGYADLLWPHKSSIISGAPTVGSKAVGNYSVVDASEILSTTNTCSSTVIHEFLHILGMPDLYRYYTAGYPLYEYDVMAYTKQDSLGEPQSLLQYNIRNMLGFAPDLSEITATTNNITLKTAQYTTNSEKSAVIIKSPYSSTEYFVVEMKQSTGVDDAVPYYGTDGGLLVYRVNTNVVGNASGPPDQEYAFRPADTSATATQGEPDYAVLKATTTSGYRSALGKARTGSTSFDNDTLFFSDGTNSGIIINNLRASGTDGITFDVTVPTSTSTGVDQWLTVGDKTYYQYADGSYATGVKEIDQKLYYFNENGVKTENGLCNVGSKYYWAKGGENGALARDEAYSISTSRLVLFAADGHQVLEGFYTTAGGKTYYQDVSTYGNVATGKKTVSGKVYLFGSDGVQKTGEGWGTYTDGAYYLQANGSLATGVKEIDQKLYYFNENGVKTENGLCNVGSKYYWAKGSENGALARDEAYSISASRLVLFAVDGHQVLEGFYTTAGGKTYYQDVSTYGNVATGKKTVSGKVYLFGSDGVQKTGEGWGTYTDGAYYLQANGSLATGVKEIDQKLYYFDGNGVKTKSGLCNVGSKYYWAKGGENGALARDEAYSISASRLVLFAADGHQVLEGFYTTAGGKTYYQDASTYGNVATGKKTVSGKVYLFGNDGVQKTGEGWGTYTDGAYYLQANGSLAIGVKEIDQKLYYFNENGVKTENGLCNVGSKYYWAKGSENGALARDEVYPIGSSRMVLFAADGHQVLEGFYTTAGGKTYYQDISTNGNIATGYKSVSNKRYYFEADGTLFKPATAGFYTKGGTQYYFNTDGSVSEPPKINSVGITAGSTNTALIVTINASFTGAVAAPLSYSFDGGSTWQASNAKEYQSGTVIAAGQIRIRDSVGYVVVYDSPVNVSSGTIGFGIDVSSHQGVIDWAAMKASGVKYAIIRAVTWQGNNIIEDPYFRTNVRNAKANGIYVGAYIYSYAFNTGEMKAEVDAFNAAGTALKAEGYTLDMPVFIDYEDARLYSATGCPATNDDRTNIVRYGMQLLQSYGYASGFYTYRNFALTKMNGQQLINEGYDFWLAHWNVATPSWDGIEMWQYGTANVGGISVDGNISYKDYTKTITGTGGTHVTTDELFTVYDLNTKQTVTASMQSILARIVANEIGTIAFSPNLSAGDYKKAYQVQAVAAHSWLMYEYSQDVVAPRVGLKSTLSDTYMNPINSAVGSVINDYILYNNQIAFTPYYASSGGYSNPSVDYWGQSFAYLTKVDCRAFEEKWVAETNSKNYYGKVLERTAAQLRADILAVQPSANLSGALSTWIVPSARNDAGYYTKVSLGGVDTPVDRFYEGVVGPYSLNFTMQVNGNDSITFTSYGYGHCVGMSQYAMLGMVRQGGYGVADILQYFYPGTTYKTIS